MALAKSGHARNGADLRGSEPTVAALGRASAIRALLILGAVAGCRPRRVSQSPIPRDAVLQLATPASTTNSGALRTDASDLNVSTVRSSNHPLNPDARSVPGELQDARPLALMFFDAQWQVLTGPTGIRDTNAPVQGSPSLLVARIGPSTLENVRIVRPFPHLIDEIVSRGTLPETVVIVRDFDLAVGRGPGYASLGGIEPIRTLPRDVVARLHHYDGSSDTWPHAWQPVVPLVGIIGEVDPTIRTASSPAEAHALRGPLVEEGDTFHGDEILTRWSTRFWIVTRTGLVMREAESHQPSQHGEEEDIIGTGRWLRAPSTSQDAVDFIAVDASNGRSVGAWWAHHGAEFALHALVFDAQGRILRRISHPSEVSFRNNRLIRLNGDGGVSVAEWRANAVGLDVHVVGFDPSGGVAIDSQAEVHTPYSFTGQQFEFRICGSTPWLAFGVTSGPPLQRLQRIIAAQFHTGAGTTAPRVIWRADEHDERGTWFGPVVGCRGERLGVLTAEDLTPGTGHAHLNAISFTEL